MDTAAFLAARIQVSDLDEDHKREALDNLGRSNFDERQVLYGILETKWAWAYAGEILRGAHVQIFDMGARYEDWSTLKSADSRGSSHASEGDQYHIDGPLVSTVLFGKTGSWTWVQLEGHTQWHPGHLIDFFKYKIAGENQGPYGSSRYVENRPIRIANPVKHEPTSWVYKVKIDRKHPFR
jgi:hypothetical protein